MEIAAAIRYCTSYLINKRDSLIVYFVLGDISLCCNKGLPILLVLVDLINFVKESVILSLIVHFS